MKQKTIFEQLGGTYSQQGDYLLPNLKMREQPEYSIGVWGCGCPVDTSAAGRSTDRADRREAPQALSQKASSNSLYKLAYILQAV
nr:hypothetical protein [uncultured Ruminococcus sp.]